MFSSCYLHAITISLTSSLPSSLSVSLYIYIYIYIYICISLSTVSLSHTHAPSFSHSFLCRSTHLLYSMSTAFSIYHTYLSFTWTIPHHQFQTVFACLNLSIYMNIISYQLIRDQHSFWITYFDELFYLSFYWLFFIFIVIFNTRWLVKAFRSLCAITIIIILPTQPEVVW